MSQERDDLLNKCDPTTCGRFLREFRVQKELGTGAFGRVYEALDVKDGCPYAVKIIKIAPRGKTTLEKAEREVSSMLKVNHENIVKYESSWFEKPEMAWQYEVNAFILNEMGLTEDEMKSAMCEMNIKEGTRLLYIQMEMCMHSLKDWLDTNRKRPLIRVHRWFKQIILALEHLHSQEINIFHRDLKPSNILFYNHDHIKICDFGTAAEIARQGEKEISKTRTNFVGTELYWSPEQAANCVKAEYMSKVDIFSCGLILHEMCIPMEPEERETIFSDYRDGKQGKLTDQPPLNDLIIRLTKVNPGGRPESKDIFASPFIKKALNLSEEAKELVEIVREHVPHAEDDRSNSSIQSNRIAYNNFDYDVLKKTIWLEARGEPQEGKVAVAHVILNRVRANRSYFGGDTIAGVCLHPWQFGAWNDKTPGNCHPFTDGWETMDGWLNAVLDGQIPDPTNGALYFNNPDEEEKPDWTNNVDMGVKIGKHQFYNDR